MKRNLAYDGLRGWLLIIIACNHLYGHFVPQLTRAPLGFVTAAEGFVFLSGFVAYLVYGRLSSNKTQLQRKVWRRCLTIYGFHITAITISFIFVWIFPFYIQQWTGFFNAENWFNNPFQSYISAILLLEHPGYHDILILYLVPMIFLPFAILAINRGQLWLVATSSVLIWLLSQHVTIQPLAGPFNDIFSDITINVSYFDPLAWQIYFYMGFILSYLKHHKGYSFDFPIAVRICLLTCITALFITKHWFPALMEPYLLGSGNASVVYQLSLLLAVYLFMLLNRHIPRLFTLKYPVFLGQHALPVFAFHTVVIYFLQPWSQAYTTQTWYWDLLICIFFIGLLTIPAKLDQIWRSSNRRNQLGVQSKAA